MIRIVVRGLLLRPLEMLSRHFVNLARGRGDQPIPETENLCDEMKALAQAHEQLRTKSQISGPPRPTKRCLHERASFFSVSALLRLGIARARRAAGSAD